MRGWIFVSFCCAVFILTFFDRGLNKNFAISDYLKSVSIASVVVKATEKRQGTTKGSSDQKMVPRSWELCRSVHFLSV